VNQPAHLPALLTHQYEYDPVDNLSARLRIEHPRAVSRRELLHYDGSGRICATQNDRIGQDETFAYDAAANLLDRPQNGAGPVLHNKLLTYQDNRYRYDGFGRLIEKHSLRYGVQQLAYDADSRLIEVRDARGNVVRMTYDPLGRRIGKHEYHPLGQLIQETRFTWEGLRLLHEQRHGLQSLYLYLYADGGHEPLARVDGIGPQQKIRHYHNDPNGLPEHLTDNDGQTVWHARYQVWGNTREETRHPSFNQEQNLRFQGQYLDRETGLHYNTFRFYDPDVGRFTTPDPIGLLGGLNLYQYAPNPIGWVDPWGLAACPRKIEQLRNGPQKTTVNVKSKSEAHELVEEAFPEAQKVRGIGAQDAQGIRKKHKMEQFKKRDGKVRYRKDYPIDKATGRVYGHDDPKGTGHGELPHINVKRADGTMVRIDIGE
jgi:RHS repeat-associated protein